MPEKITGVDILILVETETDPESVWTPVGGQRGATLSESRDTVSTTSKLSPGRMHENEYGFGEWSISCDGVYVESEEAYNKLVQAMRNRKKVKARWQEGGEDAKEGMALVTSRELEGPYDGEATYSIELQGTGEITEIV
ncbi:MAG: phage major tail protein, TP901-1 family [Firmicutes bacterium]|nr:phage major tail protein, TP901-1 family [Bacillota bacterium]